MRILPSGRFQARYLAPDGNTYNGPSTYTNEQDAWAWLAGQRRRIELEAWEPPQPRVYEEKTLTVGEMVQLWLSTVKGQVRSSTLSTYTDIMNSRVLGNKQFCAVPLDKLTTAIVARWWQETTEQFPNTHSRNNRAYQKLRSAMALAVDNGYIPANPVYIRSSLRRVNTGVKEMPTTADLKAIVNEMPHRYKLITVLCLFHGLRIGEALAIKGKSIQLTANDGVVQVQGTLSRVPNSKGGVMMEYHEPKTRAGFRTVPILSEFLPVVREHLETYQPGPEDYATTTATGMPVFDTSYRSRFNYAKKRAGITKAITPHYGRVYLITRLAEAGATPKEIGRILGQEDISTIVGVYMRAREAKSDALMRRLSLEDS